MQSETATIGATSGREEAVVSGRKILTAVEMFVFASGEPEHRPLVRPGERQIDILQSPRGQCRWLVPFNDCRDDIGRQAGKRRQLGKPCPAAMLAMDCSGLARMNFRAVCASGCCQYNRKSSPIDAAWVKGELSVRCEIVSAGKLGHSPADLQLTND